jgi:hypothetical protein
MQKQTPAASRPSFLEKFEGRNQKVNRDGLLQLLNAKRHSIAQLGADPHPAPRTKKEEQPATKEDERQPRKPVKSPSPQKQSPLPQKRIFLSQELRENNGLKSERVLPRGRLAGRGETEGEEGNHFKLPIISRSQSQSSSILKHVFTPNLQMIESDRPYKRSKEGSFYSKHSDRASKQMELDQYVLRHLEFLDKFEKQFVSSRQQPLRPSNQ